MDTYSLVSGDHQTMIYRALVEQEYGGQAMEMIISTESVQLSHLTGLNSAHPCGLLGGDRPKSPGDCRRARRWKECSYVTEAGSGCAKAPDLAFDTPVMMEPSVSCSAPRPTPYDGACRFLQQDLEDGVF